MSSSSGPSSISNGLIFEYDINNKKSWKGGPTTNLCWWGPWTVRGAYSDVSGTSKQGPLIDAQTYEFIKDGTSTQWHGWESTYGNIFTGNAGDYWTISYWYKTNAPAGHTEFTVYGFVTNDWARYYNSTIIEQHNSIIPDGEWHFNYTIIKMNEAYTNAVIADGPSWNYSSLPGILYINGLQWSRTAYPPSPYTYNQPGVARSNTQSVFDLTNTNTVTASDLTYNTDGTFRFNGLTNQMIISSFYNKPVNQITCIAWIKPTKPTITGTIRGGAISASNESGMYLGIIDSVDGGQNFALHWALQTTSGNRPWTWSGSVPNNQYSCIVGTYDGSTIKAYLNGILVGTVSLAGTIPDCQYYIGTYAGLNDNVHNFNGEIPITQIYNRALSADEVKQNFNSTRSRFGI